MAEISGTNLPYKQRENESEIGAEPLNRREAIAFTFIFGFIALSFLIGFWRILEFSFYVLLFLFTFCE